MNGTKAETVLEHLPCGVVVVAKGMVLYANTPAAELLGKSLARLIGCPIGSCLPLEVAEIVERIDQGASTCSYRGLSWKQGFSKRELSITASSGPQPGQVVLQLTEEQDHLATQAAKEFRQRLAWLDSLAAGMAHEIRNPLSGIRGAAQLLCRDLDPHEQLELTELIIRESDRIDTLVERLMALCRPRPLLRGLHCLNRIIHNEVALIEARCGANPGLNIQLDLDPSLPQIEGDEERIREAASNILRNAVEAAASHVIVRTRIVSDQHRRDSGLNRGRPVAIEVTDDGEGIEPSRSSTLFDPFSTTKAEGTGLGLFLTRLAVEEHSGKLLLEPRPGLGARFTLVFFERLAEGNSSALDPWSNNPSSRLYGASSLEMNA